MLSGTGWLFTDLSGCFRMRASDVIIVFSAWMVLMVYCGAGFIVVEWV